MTPFHKVYINPALGYWKDESKIEYITLPNYPHLDNLADALIGAKYSCAGFDLFANKHAIPKETNQELYCFGLPSLTPPDHLCLGSRCLICEATNLK